NGRRVIYCMGGAPVRRRCRDGFLSERYSARADRGARLLVLSSKIGMAAESDVHLSPMGCEPEGVVAISFSGRRHCFRYRRMAAAQENARSARCGSVLRRFVVSRIGV